MRRDVMRLRERHRAAADRAVHTLLPASRQPMVGAIHPGAGAELFPGDAKAGHRTSFPCLRLPPWQCCRHRHGVIEGGGSGSPDTAEVEQPSCASRAPAHQRRRRGRSTGGGERLVRSRLAAIRNPGRLQASLPPVHRGRSRLGKQLADDVRSVSAASMTSARWYASAAFCWPGLSGTHSAHDRHLLGPVGPAPGHRRGGAG